MLNDSAASKFVVRKWIEVNDLSGSQNSTIKNISFKVSMIRSNLCDYNDGYIVVKGVLNLRAVANTNINKKNAAFKNNAPFRSCITKIKNILIDKAEDLHIVMPMYNL